MPPRPNPRPVPLACRDVRFAYHDGSRALDGISLEVHAGERLALLGANGCGKSTLMGILAGLLFPTEGIFEAFGERVTEDALEVSAFARAFRSRVGVVFQNSEAQLFCPTVREEIAFGPLHLGLARDEVRARVDDVLELMGIAALAERAPFHLSQGEKKRVALASVLSMSPEVLLLDEPTAGLDPRTTTGLEALLTQLHAAGKTLVFATHALEGLSERADRCLIFSEAHRIVRVGTPEEILSDAPFLREVNLRG